MTIPFNDNLRRLLHLTKEMMALADEGDRDRNDDSCGILYGILRDTAYRLRALAQEECDRHREAGKWEAASGGAREAPEPGPAGGAEEDEPAPV